MADSRVGAEKVQDESAISGSIRKEGSSQNLTTFQKDIKGNLKGFSMAKYDNNNNNNNRAK